MKLNMINCTLLVLLLLVCIYGTPKMHKFSSTDLFPELYWSRGVVVIITAQLHSTKPQLRFCAGPNPACGIPEIHDGEDLWQWSRLEIRLNAFRLSTIP